MNDEATLRRRLEAAGGPGSIEAWSNGPGAVYAPHAHGYDKVIVVVAGSIAFGQPAARGLVELEAGDRLDLPAGTEHDATVGSAGVACLEKHLRPGSVTFGRRGAGW